MNKASFRVCGRFSDAKPASRFQSVVSWATKKVQRMNSALFYDETLFISCANGVVVELDRKGDVIARYSVSNLPSAVFDKLVVTY
tara:strand:- start:211 stop:465 length:255 start_codon:yes stop_codon:yes gene_type:complete